jgi:HAMP domain-containing protein
MANKPRKLKSGPAAMELVLLGTSVKRKKAKTAKSDEDSKARVNFDRLQGNESVDAVELLNILTEIKNGNFNVKMPINNIGLSGKICDTLNEIISNNKKLIKEFTKAQLSIGKEGKLNQRIVLPNAQGEWKTGVEALNALISDLAYPIREIDRVISAVAKGNLSQQIPIEVSDHLLQGEFARIAKEVNDMVKQLNL